MQRLENGMEPRNRGRKHRLRNGCCDAAGTRRAHAQLSRKAVLPELSRQNASTVMAKQNRKRRNTNGSIDTVERTCANQPGARERQPETSSELEHRPPPDGKSETVSLSGVQPSWKFLGVLLVCLGHPRTRLRLWDLMLSHRTARTRTAGAIWCVFLLLLRAFHCCGLACLSPS